jgi:hypothetical protein
MHSPIFWPNIGIFFVICYFPAGEIVATIDFTENMIIAFEHVDEFIYRFYIEA